MSEVNENLNESVEVTVADATVITVPIDTTLSNSGEAADAKAVGDALALKADASSVVAIDVNGQGADLQGHIIIDGTDVPMGGTDERTIKAAVDAAAARTGTDIPMSSATGAQTIASAVNDAANKNATNIPMSSAEGAAMISAKIAAMDIVANANSTAITNLQGRAGDSIMLETDGTQTIAAAVNERVKTVNGTGPDGTGNVQVDHALTADDLTSSESQSNIGAWMRRTSGGTASIPDGDAFMSIIRGNRVHTGYTPEVLNWVVNDAPREQGQAPITITLDRDVFVAHVAGSGTYTLTYTTSWSEDPALFGVTVTGDPVSGDQIVIGYTAEARGTIFQSNPQTLVSTGWNLYDHTKTYAIGLKYSDEALFRVEGTYTAVKYSSTESGEKSTIIPVDGYFTIDANGFIWIEGGNATDTAIYMCWKDWETGRTGSWEAYTESVIDMSALFTGEGCAFPYGLLQVGEIRDEINFNTGFATSNIERLAYSPENIQQAEETGRPYEYDTNYIYLQREIPVLTSLDELEIDGVYTANDHGLEYYTGTTVPAYTIVIYGNSLKNKLERDVVTKSQDIVNDLTSTATDKALSANMGKAINDKLEYIDTTTVISNLDDIPINAQGRITLAASVSPTGSQASFDFHCFGNDAYRALEIINTYSNLDYFNSRHNSTTWKGWENVLTTSSIKNNLTTTATGFVLDASRGKELKDSLDAISTVSYSTSRITWGNAYTTGDDPSFAIVSYGKIRQIRITIAPKNSGSDWVTVGTLAQQDYPRIDTYYRTISGGDSREVRIRHDDGVIEINGKSTTSYRIEGMFITNN